MGEDGQAVLISVAVLLGLMAIVVVAAIGRRLRRKSKRNSSGGFGSREASRVRYRADFGMATLPRENESYEAASRTPTMPPPPLSGPRTTSGKPASMLPPPYSVSSKSWTGSNSTSTTPPIPPPRERKPVWSSVSNGLTPRRSQQSGSEVMSSGPPGGAGSVSGNTVSTGTRFSRRSEKRESGSGALESANEQKELNEMDGEASDDEYYEDDGNGSSVYVGPKF